MQPQPNDFHGRLSAILASKQRDNPSYSMRAFARDLQISSSRLSEFLSKKFDVTYPTARKMVSNLELPGSEKDELQAIVDLQYSKDQEVIAEARAVLEKLDAAKTFRELQSDEIQFVTEWLHGALFEAFDLNDYPKTNTNDQVSWLAKRFHQHEVRVHGVLKRLERIGLIEQSKEGFRKTDKHFASTHGIASEHIKAAHHGFVDLARQSFNTQSIEERSYNSFLLAFNTGKMEDAKKKLHQFCRDFNEEFGAVEDADAVYCLASQFFRLDRDAGKDS